MSHSSRGKISEIGMLVEVVSSAGSERESVPCPSLCFWPLLAILDALWIVDTSFQSMSPSSHDVLSLCVWSKSLSSHTDSITELGLTTIHHLISS
jgi:hypothetical protein